MNDSVFEEAFLRWMEKVCLSKANIAYERPKDLAPFEKWLKGEMDRMGIEKAKLCFENGELVISELTYLVESPLYKTS